VTHSHSNPPFFPNCFFLFVVVVDEEICSGNKRGAQLVDHVSVGRVREEELALSCQRGADVLRREQGQFCYWKQKAKKKMGRTPQHRINKKRCSTNKRFDF
jgi:hypothetical protein